jgi:hypothetical protein
MERYQIYCDEADCLVVVLDSQDQSEGISCRFHNRRNAVVSIWLWHSPTEPCTNSISHTLLSANQDCEYFLENLLYMRAAVGLDPCVDPIVESFIGDSSREFTFQLINP